ncbi:MAG: methyltransferase domain-containing protein [Vicinamibacterales bacterium]
MRESNPPTYSNAFYDRLRGDSLGSAEALVPLVMPLVKPSRVVDLGCGIGTWLSVFKRHGATVLGFDGTWVERDQLLIAASEFVAVDLAAPFDVPGTFDLAVSLEVAEHLPAEAADRLVETLTRLAPVVLFSAAIPNQGGVHHVNERWQSYWADRFRTHGYDALDCVRPALWRNGSVAYYYAQNTLLYVERTHLQRHPELVAASRDHLDASCDVVHPALLLETVDRCAQMQDRISALEHQCRRLSRAEPGAMPFLTALTALPGLFAHAVRRRLGAPGHSA